MQPFNNFTDAFTDADRFIRENWAALPEPVKNEIEKFDGPGHSPVDRMARLTEAFYAFHKKTGVAVNTKAGRTLIGRMAGFLNLNGFQDFAGERGAKMVGAMRRETNAPLPSGATHQPADQDPAPLPGFIEDEASEPVPPVA